MSVAVPTRKEMFSDDFRAKVVAKYEEGYSYADIEREFGVSGPTIMAWVHAAGKTANRQSRVAPSSAEFRQMQDFLLEQEETIAAQEAVIDALKRENQSLRRTLERVERSAVAKDQRTDVDKT